MNQTPLDFQLPWLAEPFKHRPSCDPSLNFPSIWADYSCLQYRYYLIRTMLARPQELQSRGQEKGVDRIFVITSVLHAVSRLQMIMKHRQPFLRSVSFDNQASSGLPSHTLSLLIRGFLVEQFSRKTIIKNFCFCGRHCLGTQDCERKMPTAYLLYHS